MRKGKGLIVCLAGLLAVVGMVCALVYVFDPFQDQVDRYPMAVADLREVVNYKIDPQTILPSLERGNINVFFPASTSSEVPMEERPVLWNQSEYLKIAEAFSRFAWKESLQGWSVYGADFHAMCQDLNGFNGADLMYFKSAFAGGRILYAVRGIEISPLSGRVTGGWGTNYPHPILGWKGTDLSKVAVDAEDAVKIAEAHGGTAIRTSVLNQCRITTGLSDGSAWKVVYDDERGSLQYAFWIEIDPNSGQVLSKSH